MRRIAQGQLSAQGVLEAPSCSKLSLHDAFCVIKLLNEASFVVGVYKYDDTLFPGHSPISAIFI